MLKDYNLYSAKLKDLPTSTLLITTLNAHSYNVARKDKAFAEALQRSDVLIPDGVSVVWAERLLRRTKSKDERTKTLKKIAGEDLFYYEMKRLKKQCTSSIPWFVPKAFFLGSTEEVLAKIKARAAKEFPCIEVHTYSPPYKAEFSDEDNAVMNAAINAVNPDVLFVGMTAPKQEKWAYKIINNEELIINNCHVCCIGAVFDFYAGTVKRAPKWVVDMGMEWFYRLFSEPKRMWRRYLVGNVKFVWYILYEKFLL